MSVKIEFVDITASIDSKYWPMPAKRDIPDWYRKIPSYEGGGRRVEMHGTATNSTIKKCVPVFDALTAGYIIPFPTDVLVRIVDGVTTFHWPDFEIVRFQKYFQVGGHPLVMPEQDVPKWKNPWGIITPKGYSCFITSPLHREAPFYNLEGVVDTDTYFNPIQFPFVMKDISWEGILPAGSPMAQVIPFKRENFAMSVEKNKVDKVFKANKLLSSKFFDGYKKLFWSKKDYN